MRPSDWLFDILIDVPFDKRVSDKAKKLTLFGLLVTGDDRVRFRTVSLDNKKHIHRVYIGLFFLMGHETRRFAPDARFDQED